MARDGAGDHEAAEKAFREALRLDPKDFNANLYLGAILTKRRDLGEAKGYLDRALAMNEASTMARYEVAMWKSTSGQYDSAVIDLEKIVQEDPDWLEPHVELAAVYYRLHRPADGAKQREIVARITEQQQSRGPGR
jgi:tetratricopeptide (TPR) repeat protein